MKLSLCQAGRRKAALTIKIANRMVKENSRLINGIHDLCFNGINHMPARLILRLLLRRQRYSDR